MPLISYCRHSRCETDSTVETVDSTVDAADGTVEAVDGAVETVDSTIDTVNGAAIDSAKSENRSTWQVKEPKIAPSSGQLWPETQSQIQGRATGPCS